MKKYALIALGVLMILFILSIIFYKERIFFADGSYILFNIIRYKTLQIQLNRYGSVVSQIFPYIGVKLHLPLKVIIKGYAFSFNFFYLMIGFLLVYRYKLYELAILMALYYTILVSDSFYWPNNEIQAAVAWMFLCYGSLIAMREKKRNIFLIIVVFLSLAFITLFTHFIILISFTYLWFWFMIENKQLKFPPYLYAILTLLIGGIIYYKFNTVEANNYDSNDLHNVMHVSVQDIIHSYTTNIVKLYLKLMLTNYWIAIIVFIIGIISLLKERKFALAILTVVFVLGYIACLGVTFADPQFGNFVLFHLESEWQSFGIILATPFVFSALPKMNMRMGTVLLIVVFLVRLTAIGLSEPKFKYRTEFKRNVINEMRKKGITKLAIIDDNDYNTKNTSTWTLSIESMFMSFYQADKPQLSFILINRDDSATIKMLADPKILRICDENWTTSMWKNEYFSYDTVHPYVFMTYTELFK